ncbi:polyketide cyclase [Agrobacterium rhizogenes]|nr:polyketide cyclase [Rhizobium rhizogenes]NTJ77953.1 polyketide cyclase [Rhizobium rhizogenes]
MKAASGEVRAVVVEREIAHPPAKVWRALTQPHLMAEWLMRNDFVPVLGHRFSFHSDWGGILDCEVLIVEPNSRLSYRWNFAHDDPAFDLKSVVTFMLMQTDKGTHLRMEQVGFRPDQKQAYGGANAGWRQFLERLEQVLAEVS